MSRVSGSAGTGRGLGSARSGHAGGSERTSRAGGSTRTSRRGGERQPGHAGAGDQPGRDRGQLNQRAQNILLRAVVASLCVWPGAALGAQPSTDDRRPLVAEQSFSAQQVDAAFAAARSGDFGPSAEFQHAGPEIAPLIGRYVGDRQEDVRRQAVTLLGLIGGAEAAGYLADALADPSSDIRARAASALYQQDPDRLAGNPAVGEALRRSIGGGNDAGGAILLLGYFRSAESEAALTQLQSTRGSAMTEVYNWSPVVGVALVADVALAHLGNRAAVDRLTETIAAGDLATLEFMLYTLRDVEDPALFHALAAATLGDQREVQGNVPAGAEPQLRLADLAATKLVERLELDVGFEVSDATRYSEDEIGAVRAAIEDRVPR